MIAKGLLLTMVRAKDGADITVEGLAETHDEGRASLEKAMRSLVADAYVVKFKIQQQASDGERRGGAWRTEVIADTVPIDREWVGEQLAAIIAEGNVRAVRIEPAHLDPRAENRAATGRRIPAVGPTCGNVAKEEETAGGTDRCITDGRSTDRRSGGGSIRKKTVVKDSLSGHMVPTGDEPKDVTEGRESSAAREDDRELAAVDAGELQVPPPVGVPQQRESDVVEDQEQPEQQLDQADAEAFALSLPHVTSKADVARVLPGILRAAALGMTPDQVRAHLDRMVNLGEIRNPGAVSTLYARHLEPKTLLAALAVTESAKSSARPGADKCTQHRVYDAGDCPLCIKAARVAAIREDDRTEDPAPVDGSGLLARLRAGMSA
ncbi:hypothetical protein [Streptomyces sp. CAI-85]|uniref:hypothetical protein n=1 Tax=Streptomyces sp. CAI-85 TaxID=1472662 RepID=UPI00158794D9|nr:hypothetical protein [Streptomyces sp. CAI-85]NUV64321.1 hypothetical protein [Streptomyces sp. CAI-85]